MISYLNHLKKILQSNYIIIFLIVFLFLTYVYTINVKKESIYNQEETNFIGTIIKKTKTDYGYSLTIKGKEKLIIYTKKCSYNLGDLVLVKGKLELPKNNTVPNNFNYKKYLSRQNIFYLITSDDITLLRKNKNIKYKIKILLENYLDKYKSNLYLKNFILGESYKEVYEVYQKNGLAHLLSISSLQIVLINKYLNKLFKKLKIPLILIYLIIFLILSILDFPISLLRSCLYLFISYLLDKLKIKTSPIFKFTLITIITLIINPFYLYNKGFMYSYLITFLLMINKNNITGNKLVKLIKISLISFLGSIPLNIYYNYEINFLSLIYNIFYVPIFNLIVFPFSLLTIIFYPLDNLFFNFMNKLSLITSYLSKITFLTFNFKKISIFILIIYILLIIYVINTLLKKKYKSLIMIITVLLIHLNINKIIPTNQVIFLDVGQGDASFISLENKNILIDTGGLFSSNPSEEIITMLKSFGINKLDFLIISHGDFDHMGDSIYFVNNFKVSNVILNEGPYNELEKKLLKVLEEKGIKSYNLVDSINIENVEFKFLNTKIYDNENDNSRVIYFNYKTYKFLFMGDASIKKEKDVILNYNLEDIDFLKVGHHGSNTSSSKEFIDSINPRYSMISVGKNNRYGHPKASVLSILKNSKVYRTDIDGSIIVNLNKDKYRISTCSP